MIETLATHSRTLEVCPAFVSDPQGLPVECGRSLRLVATRDVVGDDYGSWPLVSVAFECGHSIDDIASSLRHADEI